MVGSERCVPILCIWAVTIRSYTVTNWCLTHQHTAYYVEHTFFRDKLALSFSGVFVKPLLMWLCSCGQFLPSSSFMHLRKTAQFLLCSSSCDLISYLCSQPATSAPPLLNTILQGHFGSRAAHQLILHVLQQVSKEQVDSRWWIRLSAVVLVSDANLESLWHRTLGLLDKVDCHSMFPVSPSYTLPTKLQTSLIPSLFFSLC